MQKDYFFITALILFSAACEFCAVYAAIKFKPANLHKAEKIPRNIPLGAIFGAAAIAWCVPQALDVFSSNAVFQYSFAAFAAFLIGCFFLDYLFARALAGFLILLSHYFMAQSFAADLPFLWVFSIFVLAMGSFAIVIGGIPHYLRDIIRKMCRSSSFKFSAITLFIVYGLISFAAALFQMIG